MIIGRWENLCWGNTNDPNKNWDVTLEKRGEAFEATLYRKRDMHPLTSVFFTIQKPFDSAEEFAKECEPVIENDETFTFATPSYKETLDGSHVRCLKGRTHWVWQLYNPANNSRIYLPFHEMRASARCGAETAQRILELNAMLQEQTASKTLKDYQCVFFAEESVIDCASRIQLGAKPLKEINCDYKLAQDPSRKITLNLSTTSSVPSEFWKDSKEEFVPFFIQEDRGCSLVFLSLDARKPDSLGSG